jgi:cysteine sulfinate desulfinase/cysteine desulfurase-like protein
MAYSACPTPHCELVDTRWTARYRAPVSAHLFTSFTHAPLRPGVLRVMQQASQLGANAASLHESGRQARRLVDTAHLAVLRCLGGVVGEVLLTGSRYEAHALAVLGMARHRAPLISVAVRTGDAVPNEVLLSPSMIASSPELPPLLRRYGYAVHPAVLGDDGLINLQWLQQHFEAGTQEFKLSAKAAKNPTTFKASRTATVPRSLPAGLYTPPCATVVLSVSLSDDACGHLQPLQPLAALCLRYGVALHVDVGPAIGRHRLVAEGLTPQAWTLCARAVGGPAGMAAVVLQKDLEVVPLWGGGGQARGMRPGSEAVALAAGYAQALTHLEADLQGAGARRRLLGQLAQGLRQALAARLQWQILLRPGLGESLIVRHKGRDLQAVQELLADGGVHTQLLPAGTPLWGIETLPHSAVQLALGYATTSGDVLAAQAAFAALPQVQPL